MAVGAIDLGATNLRAAVADEPREPLAVERAATPTGDGDAAARAAAGALADAADSAGVSVHSLEAVGVGTVGPLDRAAGAVVDPPNLPGVERVPLRDAIVALVGHPKVFVENDAVAGLVGERAAADGPADDCVYLTLSTGVGAGAAVDGHVLRGRSGNAAEVGHLVVEPGGRRCGCGGAGHWEAYCAGAAIPGLARDIAGSEGVETALDLGDLAAPELFAAAGGDPLADRTIELVQRYNAIGLADLVHAYAPVRIAVGGSVALENRELVIDPLAEAVAEHTMLEVPEIAPAAHGGDAVLVGALHLAAGSGLG